jgi:branched-chain amino acid transport system ATP-binding protein
LNLFSKGTGEDLLELKDITVHYGGVAAIKGVSLDVEEGSIATLIGANGAGKSTTLRAISGLEHPSSGQIWFRGKRIDGLSPQNIVKRRIAHAPEGKRLFRLMSVLDNLYMGAFLRKDRAAIRRNLEQIWQYFPILKDRQKQVAGSLSGGEQQMLTIARALMSDPSLLLLDEPSLGLAPFFMAKVARIIEDVNRAEITIILIEQNANLALRLAHKAYVMERGEVVLEGTGQELKGNKHVREAYLGVK